MPGHDDDAGDAGDVSGDDSDDSFADNASGDDSDDSFDDGMADYPALVTPGFMTTRKQIRQFVCNMHGYLAVPDERDKAASAYDAHASKFGVESVTVITLQDSAYPDERSNWTRKTTARIPGTHKTVTCFYG
jgi:hypothetical protein